MKDQYENVVVEVICRILVPFVQIFAFYVILHGHYSPGGGFQGGTILAASAILLRLSLTGKEARKFSSRFANSLGPFGLLIYGGVGLLALIAGGMYLDYAHLPFPFLLGPYLRHLGILLVEIGVALGVFATLLSIFDRLSEGSE